MVSFWEDFSATAYSGATSSEQSRRSWRVPGLPGGVPGGLQCSHHAGTPASRRIRQLPPRRFRAWPRTRLGCGPFAMHGSSIERCSPPLGAGAQPPSLRQSWEGTCRNGRRIAQIGVFVNEAPMVACPPESTSNAARVLAGSRVVRITTSHFFHLLSPFNFSLFT